MIIFEKDFEEETWENAWDEWAAREAAAQAYYDALSDEEFEASLEEGNRLWALVKE